MYFNQEGDISTLNGYSLISVDMFICLVVASRQLKVVSVYANIKCGLLSIDFQSYESLIFGCISTILWMHHVGAWKTYTEKAKPEMKQYAWRYIEQIYEATPHETISVPPLTSHLLQNPNKTRGALLQK